MAPARATVAPVGSRLQLNYLIGVTVDDNVCVVRRNDDLAPPLEPLERREDRVEEKPVVQLVLRLVDD